MGDAKRLLEIEGMLVPSPRMHRLMQENGCWNRNRVHG
jgi:hypothetical protein